MKKWKILAKAFLRELKTARKVIVGVPGKVKPRIAGFLIGTLLSVAVIVPLMIMAWIYGDNGKPGVFDSILFAAVWLAWGILIIRIYESYSLLIDEHAESEGSSEDA